MGIEDVASFAGCTKMEARATIRSTLSRTSSAASSGSRAVLPSAARNSIRMFWPSIQPLSRRPDRKACHRRASAGSEALFVKIPTRYTFPDCCASAPTGAVRRPPATLPRNALLEITESPHPPAAAGSLGSSARVSWRS